MTKTFSPLLYWKLKAIMLEIVLREERVRAIADNVQAAKVAALMEVGLDPAKSWTLDDASFTAVAAGDDQG